MTPPDIAAQLDELAWSVDDLVAGIHTAAAAHIRAQAASIAELEREIAAARDAALEDAANAADLQALASQDTKYRDACWASAKRIRALQAKRGEDG